MQVQLLKLTCYDIYKFFYIRHTITTPRDCKQVILNTHDYKNKNVRLLTKLYDKYIIKREREKELII